MDAGRWPLVGRESELETLRMVLADEPPGSVVLAGPPGVGRTRLAHEALDAAARLGRPTLWAAATAPAAAVPLGALAHLLPPVEGPSDPLMLLQRAAAAIAGDGAGLRPVLVVDDVHLLDQLSVTLLHQLAARGVVSLVLTVRTGGLDPAAPLWKDGLAGRMEVAELDRCGTGLLIAAALGKAVGSRTEQRLWELTQGNPLYLREVLVEGQRSGQLRDDGGAWRWEGPLLPSQRLVEIVLSHIGDLDADQWRVLELLATGEPMSVPELLQVGSTAALAGLERRGLITSVPGDGRRLRPAHQVHAAVVRSRVSQVPAGLLPARPDQGPRDARSDGNAEHRADPAGDGCAGGADPGRLTVEARRALDGFDLAAAEELARAALDAGGGLDAVLVLAEVLRWTGRSEDAEQLAADAAPAAASGGDRARLTVARVLTLLCGPGRRAEALALLQAEAEAADTEDARAVLCAGEAVVFLLLGDLRRAQRHAAAARSTAGRAPRLHGLALAAEALALALAGRAGGAEAAAAGARRGVRTDDGDEQLLVRVLVSSAEVVALHLAGRLIELDALTERRLEENLAVPEWPGDAVVALHRGWAQHARGRSLDAVRWLREADGGLRRGDPAAVQGLCVPLLAIAEAGVGDAASAAARLAAAPSPGLPLFAPWRPLASAHVAAAEDRLGDARRGALEAAARAAASGQEGVRALALHQLVRWGAAADAAGPLREMADRLDAAFLADLAAFAGAVAAGDGVVLEDVSGRLERAGALRDAAEAAAAAAAAHEEAGYRRAATDCRARAARLFRDCGVDPTRVGSASPMPTLTLREEEVALLALSGQSNQTIADRLVVSVRTVEAHLSHVYAKFGINNRAELAFALEAATRTSPPHQPLPH